MSRNPSLNFLAHFEFNCPEDITVGQPFQVRFCSGEYDKTSTNKMWFVWGFGDAGSGIDQKIPVVEMTPNIGSGYLFNTTIDYSTSSVDGNYTVGILEYINDYYVVSIISNRHRLTVTNSLSSRTALNGTRK